MRILLTILVAVLACFTINAQNAASTDSVEAIDTVYIYNNWNGIINNKPVTAFSGPIAYSNNELEIEIYTTNREAQLICDFQAIAICLGDSAWYLNSYYLDNHFDCDYRNFNNYVSLLFTGKIALIQYWEDYPEENYLRMMPTAHGGQVMESVPFHRGNAKFYYIDFINKAVRKVDYKLMTGLLANYPELQRRYLGMKKYKTSEVIDFFLQKYIDKLNDDSEALTILEQINLSNK